jgi:hypothetical protein
MCCRFGRLYKMCGTDLSSLPRRLDAISASVSRAPGIVQLRFSISPNEPIFTHDSADWCDVLVISFVEMCSALGAGIYFFMCVEDSRSINVLGRSVRRRVEHTPPVVHADESKTGRFLSVVSAIKLKSFDFADQRITAL